MSKKSQPKIKKQNGNILSILTHLLGIFTGIIGPLIILLVTDEEKVKKHSRKALNWQISYIIYSIISFILVFLLIGFLLLPVFAILNIVFCIIATVKASEGILWDYPLAIPFLKD